MKNESGSPLSPHTSGEGDGKSGVRRTKPVKRCEPKTPAEWQEAVDAAAAARVIADCKMYGLLEGGPEINVARCDDILERGRARGVRPSKPAGELAVEMARAINEGDASPVQIREDPKEDAKGS